MGLNPTIDAVLDRLRSMGITLYPWQESALRRLWAHEKPPVTSCLRGEREP